MLPSNILDLDLETKELITILEQSMLTHTAAVPIYFAPYNKDLEKIIDDITYTTTDNAGQNQTALGQLIVTVSANRYHVNVGGGSIVANKNSKVPIIHGELIPNQLALKPTEAVGDVQKLPVILITANLKTFGIYNVSNLQIFLHQMLYFFLIVKASWLLNKNLQKSSKIFKKFGKSLKMYTKNILQ